MAHSSRGARTFRVAELWHALPVEAQRIYRELEPSEGKNSTALNHRQLLKNRIALEALASLCNGNPDVRPASVIARFSLHLRGSALERTLYRHAIEARTDDRLRAIMTPAIGELIDEGILRIRKYVTSGRPFVLDDYRAGFVLLKTAAMFNPPAVNGLEGSLRRMFGHQTKEYPIIESLLPSTGAWGSDPANISLSDLRYMNFWRQISGTASGSFHANHVLAYYAPPRQGRRLTEMTPEDAKEEMMNHAHGIRESLIDEARHKCAEGYANAAWIAATFLKLQTGLKYLDGGWTKLSPSQARKIQNFILFARSETQRLDGADGGWLRVDMSNVETSLMVNDRYGLKGRIYRGRSSRENGALYNDCL